MLNNAEDVQKVAAQVTPEMTYAAMRLVNDFAVQMFFAQNLDATQNNAIFLADPTARENARLAHLALVALSQWMQDLAKASLTIPNGEDPANLN